MNRDNWTPTIRRDILKRHVDAMMKSNMKLYEQILDDPSGFGYHFNKLLQLGISEFHERRPQKKRKAEKGVG